MGSIKGRIPVPKSYIAELCDKVDDQEYGLSIRGGLSGEDQKKRNKALISILYLAGRRVGEVCRRLRVKDFRFTRYMDREVIILSTVILKRKGHPRFETMLSLEDEPFIGYILDWLEIQQQREEEHFMPICESRAWQIVNSLDPNINTHWFRHMRMSHLAEYLDPYQLTNNIGHWASLSTSIAYVHSRASNYLDAVEKV